MNIEDLTLKQIKELSASFTTVPTTTSVPHPFLGKTCLIRTYSAGVHFGTLDSVSADGKQVILSNAQRIWSWTGALSLSEVAIKGIATGKIAIAVPSIALTEVIEIIPMSIGAEQCIRGK